MAKSPELGGLCAADGAQNPAGESEVVLGYPLLKGDRLEILNILIGRLKDKLLTHVVTLNPEMVVGAASNPVVRETLGAADLFVADGVGIEWAANRRGKSCVTRFPGVDLAYSLLQYLGSVGGSVYLLGGKPGIAAEAAARLTEKLPGLKISGCADGYFRKDAEMGVIKEISTVCPDVLLVGLGSPKQESFISRNRVELGVPLMIGVGGSLEVFAGRKRRAPSLLQKFGLEWAHRSILDVSRLKRLGVLPRFIWLVLSQPRVGQVD